MSNIKHIHKWIVHKKIHNSHLENIIGELSFHADFKEIQEFDLLWVPAENPTQPSSWEIQKAIKNMSFIRRNRFWVRMCCVGAALLPLTWHCFWEKSAMKEKDSNVGTFIKACEFSFQALFKILGKHHYDDKPLKLRFKGIFHKKSKVGIYSPKPAWLFVEHKRRLLKHVHAAGNASSILVNMTGVLFHDFCFTVIVIVFTYNAALTFC